MSSTHEIRILQLFFIGCLVNVLKELETLVGKDKASWHNPEDYLLNISDLKPGMSSVNIKVTVSNTSKPKQITTGKGIEHEILEVEVKDETGTMTLVLWDEKVVPLKVGDTLRIENGFVTSFKGEWRINVGKYGEIAKL